MMSQLMGLMQSGHSYSDAAFDGLGSMRLLAQLWGKPAVAQWAKINLQVFVDRQSLGASSA